MHNAKLVTTNLLLRCFDGYNQILLYICKIKLQVLNHFGLMYAMCRGPGPGGAGGAWPPLELGIYRVKILKIRKISFFLLVRPP